MRADGRRMRADGRRMRADGRRMKDWCVLLLLSGVSPAATPSLPLYFEENRGQSAAEVRFLASGSPGIFFTQKETVLAFTAGDVLRIQPDGAAASAPEPLELLPGKSNYLNREPAITGIRQYGRIRYRSVYPGIDLLYYGRGNELEYDFAISPGARPERIRLTLQGASELRIDAEGNLVARLRKVSFIQRKPAAWQSGDGGVPHRVEVGYFLTGKKQVAFAIGTYDRSRPLIIDPLVDYATYLGASGPPFEGDVVSGIAADAAGNAYVTGNAQSGKFPFTSGGVASPTSGLTGFVAKLSADGANLVYSTYLNLPPAQAIAVDSQGSAYVTGSPTGNGANYVVKLTPDGSAFAYSHTFANNLGGSSLSHLVLDSAQNVYVSGTTSDTRFPTTSGSYQSTFPGQIGLFGALSAYGMVMKLNAAGNVAYSTYLRDPVPFNGNTMQFFGVDGNQDAMIMTLVPSSSPGQGPQSTLLKLNPSGSGALSTLTFPNASTPINVLNFGTDPAGNLYVIGGGSLSSNSAGPLIAELDSNGVVVKGHYLEVASGSVLVDNSGNAYVVGNEPDGGVPFITRVDSSFTTDATFFPSIAPPPSSTSLPDTLQFVALDPAGNLYLTLSNPVFGQTPHFPATPGAYQTEAGAFAVVKLDAAALAAGVLPTVTPGGVTNAASGQSLLIAPGEILAVYGVNLGPAQLISASFDANGRLPTSLAGTQLVVGGVPVPLLYSSANQIAGIAPLSLAASLASPGPPPLVSIQVGYQGIGSVTITNSLLAIPVAPGLFTSDASGHGQGAILNQDGSINSVAHPAAPGSVVSLFCSGCGITAPLGTDGTLATSIASLVNPIGVTIGGQIANVSYAGSAPGLVNGAVQINVTVPTGISGDAVPIGLSAPGAPPSVPVTMAVH
jgi:uncharacterized protein (TIGR03437 family)